MRVSLFGLTCVMVLASGLLWLWLIPVELDTKGGIVRSYGWPIKTHWMWTFEGGRYHENGWGVPIVVLDILLCGLCLWAAYWLVERSVSLVRSRGIGDHQDETHPKLK